MTTTAMGNDQEQGDGNADGRTGLEAEGGGRADQGSDHISLDAGSLGLWVEGRGGVGRKKYMEVSDSSWAGLPPRAV